MRVLITADEKETGTNYRIGDVVEVGEADEWGDRPIIGSETGWGSLWLVPDWFMEVPDSVPLSH